MGDATDGCDPPMTIWLLRAVWATLPLTAGPAAAEVLRSWAGPPRTLAAAILWAAWAAGLLATFAPRPWGLTVTRTAGPLFVAAALAAVVDGSPAMPGAGAVAATGLAALLSGSPGFGLACANGAAYGDESRFPLKTPPPLFVGVLPVAVLVVGAGAVSGPLLLADRRWLAGAVLTVVGWAAVGATVPMIHRLSRRWVVLVPAGLVIADPLTLADPTLFPRERIRSVASCAAPRPGRSARPAAGRAPRRRHRDAGRGGHPPAGGPAAGGGAPVHDRHPRGGPGRAGGVPRRGGVPAHPRGAGGLKADDGRGSGPRRGARTDHLVTVVEGHELARRHPDLRLVEVHPVADESSGRGGTVGPALHRDAGSRRVACRRR